MKNRINFILLTLFMSLGVHAVNAQSTKKASASDFANDMAQKRQQRDKILSKVKEQQAQLQYEQKAFPGSTANQQKNPEAPTQNNLRTDNPSPAINEIKPHGNNLKNSN